MFRRHGISWNLNLRHHCVSVESQCCGSKFHRQKNRRVGRLKQRRDDSEASKTGDFRGELRGKDMMPILPLRSWYLQGLARSVAERNSGSHQFRRYNYSCTDYSPICRWPTSWDIRQKTKTLDPNLNVKAVPLGCWQMGFDFFILYTRANPLQAHHQHWNLGGVGRGHVNGVGLISSSTYGILSLFLDSGVSYVVHSKEWTENVLKRLRSELTKGTAVDDPYCI